MRTKVQFLFVMLLLCIGLPTYAQKDITAYVLSNAGFDDATSWQAGNVAAGDSQNSLAIAEWTTAQSAAWSSSAAFGYGTASQINGAAVPDTNPDGEAEGGALGVSCGWGGTVAYSQKLSRTLPAGTYIVKYKAFNASSAAQMTAKISFAGTEKVVATSFTSNVWEEKSAEFTLEAETAAAELKISFTAVSNGSGSNAKIFIDGVTILAPDEVYEAWWLEENRERVVEEAYEVYRAATAEIYALDQKLAKENGADYENKVATDEVLAKMNLADQALAAAQDALDTDVTALLDEAADYIKQAKALAQENYETIIAEIAAEEAKAKFESGEYILKTTYNGETYYLAGSNFGGTEASLVPYSVAVNLAKISNGVYTITMPTGMLGYANGNENGALFCDAPSLVNIAMVENLDGTYTLSISGRENSLIGVINSSSAAGTPAVNYGAAEALKWTIVSTAKEKIVKGDDVTFLVKCADFGRNNENRDAWTAVADNKNLDGGLNENHCAESRKSAFTVTQELTDLPNGYYTLTAQAAFKEYTETGKDFPVVFANDATVPFCIMDGTDNTHFDNNGNPTLSTMSDAFIKGKYVVTVPVKVTDGKLTIGVKGTRTDTWCTFDNFTLTYKGDDATEYNDFMNRAADERLKAALDELKEKLNEAKATVAGYDAFVQTAVAGDLANVEKAIRETVTEGEGEAAHRVEKGIEPDIEAALCAAELDKQPAAVEDGIMTRINAQLEAIQNILDEAKSLQDTNDAADGKLTAAYEDLVAQWQDAYDKINTKYKEYLNGDSKYDSYLRILNNIYVQVDGIGASIATNKEAGSSDENKEKILGSISDLSDQIASVLQTALQSYSDDVADANAKAYEEVTKKVAEMTEQYKDAINLINDHYATYHPEAAAAQQSKLFAVYRAIQDAEAAATETFTKVEKTNAQIIAENADKTLEVVGDLPLQTYDNTADMDALDDIDMNKIQDALAAAEALAEVDNAAAYTSYNYKYTALQTKLGAVTDKIDALDLVKGDYEDDIDAITSSLDDLNKNIEAAKTDAEETTETPAHKEEVEDVDEEEQPTGTTHIEYTCFALVASDLDAQIDEIDALIDELDAKLKGDNNQNIADDMNELIAQARKDIADAKAELAKYDETVQEKYAGKYDKVSEDLDAIEKEVEDALADGTLADKKAAITAEITNGYGDVPGVGVEDLADAMFHEWSTVDAEAEITGNVPNIYFESHIGVEVDAGGTVYGNSNVKALAYAQLGDYKSVVIKFTSAGGVPRLLFGRSADGANDYTEISNAESDYVTASEDEETGVKTWIIDLAKVAEGKDGLANLNAIKSSWGGKVTISSVALLKEGQQNTTIYQKINAIALPAANDNAKVDGDAVIADLNAQLSDLNDAIDALGSDASTADIKTAIDKLEKDMKDDYAAGTLTDLDVDTQAEQIEQDIANTYTNIYKADLDEQIDDLKAVWNDVYATGSNDADVDEDDAHTQIENMEQKVKDAAAEGIDTDEYEALSDEIESLSLMFSDYMAWVEENTILGDANLSETVNIADAILTVNVALEKEELNNQAFWAADVNKSNTITVADAQAIVNFALGIIDNFDDAGEEEGAEAKARGFAGENCLVVDKAGINLINTTEFVAFQMDVTLAAGAELKGVTATERTKGMHIDYNTLSDNRVRIVAISLDNAAIAGEEGALVNLNIVGNQQIAVSDIEFVDALCNTYVLDIIDNGEATGIADIEAGKAVNGDIYAVNGAKLNTLQKGINIVKYADGSVKKVYVK